MELLFGIFLVAAWVAVVILMRVVTTFLHELGHAIPALVFTAKPVEMYIGSYGQKVGSWTARIGRLSIYFIPRVIAWNMGMCRHEAVHLSLGQRTTILLGGPLASVIVAGIGLSAMVYFDFGEVSFMIVAAFLLSALWDLFVNLLPTGSGSRELHYADQGRLSDGTQLAMLWRESRLPPRYHEMRQLLETENYEKVIASVEADLAADRVQLSVLPIAIKAYQATGEYGGALSIYEAIHKRTPLRSSDYFQLGELYQKLGNYTEAINCYGEFLHESFSNVHALYARGICYQEMGEHGAALREFTTVLNYDPGHAAAWRSRAYSFLRINDTEAAGNDLMMAEKLEPDHPRFHLYNGFYQEKSGNYAAAHTALLKAQELGDKHHGIPFHLSELERQL